MKSEMFDSLLLKMKNHRRKGKLIAILALVLVMGTASATVFTTYYGNATATVKAADIQLIAGPDSTASPTTYPAATVTVASTSDYATVAFSLFRSASNTPQPATYYTNLLQIKNNGGSAHTIKGLTISGITNAANLGSMTIYLYAAQTDSPETGTPIASQILNSGSAGPYTLASNYNIAAGATIYVEIVGYAASGAALDSTVSFNIGVQWV